MPQFEVTLELHTTPKQVVRRVVNSRTPEMAAEIAENTVEPLDAARRVLRTEVFENPVEPTGEMRVIRSKSAGGYVLEHQVKKRLRGGRYS